MNARQMIARFADGGDVSTGLKYATDKGGIGADQYYANIRKFINTQGADLNAAEVRAEMNKYGVSDKDVRDALAGTQYSAGAVHALLNPDIGAKGSPGYGVGGLEGMSANIRARLEEAAAQAQTGALTKTQAEDFFKTHLSPTGGFNEQDLMRATGKSSAQLLAEMKFKPAGAPVDPRLLPPTEPLPDLTEEFVAPTAPPPQAPPAALTTGQEGLDPSTAIVGAIPQSERVTIPQLDTEFRASEPRTPTYDRFGRITGYNYSPAAKLTPATGTNVFNFVPPGITSRPRSLLNIGDVPGVTVDPVTGQMRMPLSASQRFARDRAELDNQFRQLYARAAAADTSLPTQAPATAAAAFRQFAMNDPTMSAQLRMRDIEQTPTVNPTAAMTAARSEFGAAPYAAALTQAFDPFLARNRASLLASKDMQRSYFERYPDLVAEYEKNWSKTMSPEEYAAYHYRTLGQKEGRTPPNTMGSPYTQQFFSKGGDVSRETSEVPQLTPEGQLIDENAEMRSESQRMLNRLKTAQQESYRRGKLPPGIQRAVTDVASEEKPPLIRGKAIQTAGDIVGGLVSATPREPTNPSEAYRLMQGFTGAYLPTAPVVRTAQAAKMAAQEPRATMSAAGRSARESLEALGDIPVALAQPNQLGAQAGAVRPYGKGTVFSGVKLANDRSVGSSLDDYIDQGKSAAFSVPEVNTADAIQKFFDTKARRYMSTQLGTERDPVFDAIKKGRISNLALHDIQGLRRYAIEAAGEGKYKVDKETGKNVLDQYGRPIFYPKDPQAVMDVTKAYDEMVNVRPMSFKPGLIPKAYGTKDPLYEAEFERVREQMRQAFEDEGLDPRLVNLKSDPMILTSARDTGEPYYPGYLYRMDDFIKDKLSGDPEAMKGVPENIRRALDQGELLYDVGLNRGPLEDILDPENMAKYLATLSPKEIDKIRFEDAVVGSAKLNREKIDRKFEGLRIQELVKSGKAPDKVFSKGVSEPLLQFGEDQRYPGFAWKRLEDINATIPEGAYVGHSVGGYVLGGIGYGPKHTKGFLEGTHEIYSLRNDRNRPVTTIQVINEGSEDNPFRVVKQIKGNGVNTGNTAPVNYDEEVYGFLTQVVKPDAIEEKNQFLTPLLIQYRDALEANRQTR